MNHFAALLAVALLALPHAPAAAEGATANAPKTPEAAEDEQPGWLRAQGNEPFWSLDITFGRALFNKVGGERPAFLAPVSSVEKGEEWTRYVAEQGGERLVATVRDRVSACDMTGMPYPKTVVVQWGGRTLAGRGGDPADLLAGREWTVREIAGSGAGADFAATFRFFKDGTLFGQTPEGPFAARYRLTGESLGIFRIAAFFEADAPAGQSLTQRLLALLGQADLFAIGEDGSLALLAQGERTVVAAPGRQ